MESERADLVSPPDPTQVDVMGWEGDVENVDTGFENGKTGSDSGSCHLVFEVCSRNGRNTQETYRQQALRLIGDRPNMLISLLHTLFLFLSPGVWLQPLRLNLIDEPFLRWADVMQDVRRVLAHMYLCVGICVLSDRECVKNTGRRRGTRGWKTGQYTVLTAQSFVRNTPWCSKWRWQCNFTWRYDMTLLLGNTLLLKYIYHRNLQAAVQK